jgi:amidase
VTGDQSVPVELLEAFWRYERALAEDDLDTLDVLFAAGPRTLRGDRSGLLVGHDSISQFHSLRQGALSRQIASLQVRVINDDYALMTAVTAPLRGGHGQQTQLWQLGEHGWVIITAHVSDAPETYDASVWRTVGDPLVEPLGAGPLAGESIAVKDLFAVAGFRIGAGVPQYLAEQSRQAEHAPALLRLLAAGASVRGIARTDQFAYSIDGDNPHYGTPVNAAVPGGLPGGSSSGSATAVALGAATIGLGTDTGGSIRVPASYQGLWGVRTTHGDVPLEGLVPLAPDFDTVGLLARTSDRLTRATHALLDGRDSHQLTPAHILTWTQLAAQLPNLDKCYEAFRIRQGYQAWQLHGRWITDHPDALLGSVRSRFATAAAISAADDASARAALKEYRAQLEDLLADHVLVMPSTPGPAPRRGAGVDELEPHRRATLRLTCLASITGRPVVSAPSIPTTDEPTGTSYLGPSGSELALIRLAAQQAS